MLKIDLDYAKFVYEYIMLPGVYGSNCTIGLIDIGYPEGSGFKLWG